MKFVTSTEIVHWADMRISQSQLPQLVRRLIFATIDLTNIVNITFPGGDDVYRPGYDGSLSCRISNTYVPEGESVWELSVENNPRAKAEDDYQKRKNDPLGCNPNVTTYIVVSARKWAGKQDWIEDKKQDHYWKDIRVYDATDLESWLETSLGVQVWFADQLGIRMDGIDTLENYVTGWFSMTNLLLNSELALLGRQDYADQLLGLFANATDSISIKSITFDEAIIFLFESVNAQPDPIKQSMLSRMLIVDNGNALKDIARLSISNLIIVVKYSNMCDLVYSHKLRYIIPLDYSNTASTPDIVIPRIEIRFLVVYLKRLGLTEEQARLYANNSGGSLSILKRLFSDIKNQPVWAKSERFHDIFPILVLQSWDTRKEGDNAVLQTLAETDKDSYQAILKTLLYLSDSPVIKIGELWKLASAYDTWSALLPYLTKANFETIKRIAIAILSDLDPTLRLEPEKRWSAAVEGVIWQYSSEIRKGIANTLILLALYGEQSGEFTNSTSQDYIDSIISEVLEKPDWQLWHSLSDVMPQLAEATPNVLLTAMEKSLTSEDKPIMGMFSETDDFMKSSSGHTGLLWALESLAWDEKYTARATLVLSQLALLDPGGRLANRPISSLISVFRLWLPQTEVDSKTRFEIIDLIIARYPAVAWTLLLGLTPEQLMVGSFSYKYVRFNWRETKTNYGSQLTSNEYLESLSKLVERLIILTNHNPARLAKLIERLVNFPMSERDKIIEYITKIISDVEDSSLEVYNALRKLISFQKKKHRSHETLNPDELYKIKTIYGIITPKSAALKYKYLFDEFFPDVVDTDVTYEEESTAIAKFRSEAALLITQEMPIDALFDYINTINQPRLLAIAIPVDYFLKNLPLINSKLDSKSSKEIEFIQAALSKADYELGSEWGISLLHQGVEEYWNNVKIVNLLLCLKPDRNLWDIIIGLEADVQKDYWSKCHVNPYETTSEEISFALDQLKIQNRYYSALEYACIRKEEIPIDLIVKLLLESVNNRCSEPTNQMVHYYMEELIKLTVQNEEIPTETKVKIEWAYIPLLTSLYSGVTPKYLHTEMSSDPNSFMMIIKMMYRPKGVEHVMEKQLTEDEIKTKQMIANNAWQLMNSWKLLPGLQEDGTVDYTQLKKWINGVIELAKQEGYEEICNCYIGKILAHSPVDASGQWPVDAVCQIIEEYHNDTLDNNFQCEEYNKRGTTVRSPYDGGDQERALVKKYTDYAQKFLRKYPHTAKVVTNIAEGYTREAQREDLHAEEYKSTY
jgi:hypothetical protein